jgi:hypothetical protein
MQSFNQDSCIIPPASSANRNVRAFESGHSHRPRVLQVEVPSVPPKYYVEISINDTDEMEVRHMLGSSTINKYTVESSFRLWPTSPAKSPSHSSVTATCKQDRRYKEFYNLFQLLRKEFPTAMIPALPVIDTSKELDTSLVLRRKRQLALWLQYISLHEALQLSDSFREFLSADSQNSQQQQQQQQQTQKQRRNSYLTKRLATLDDSKLSSNSRRALIRELAHRNVLTVKR